MRASDRRRFARISWNDFHQTGVSGSNALRSRLAASGTVTANEENDMMKRIAAYLASAALGAALVGSGPAWAQMRSDIAWRYPYNPDNYAYNYGYPYAYGYPYNFAYGYRYPSNYASGYPSSYAYGYGYPYANSYGYANPFAIVTAPIAALAAPATALTTPVAAATSAA